MPHKHSRRERNASDFDLPPTQIAKPLPVTFHSKKHAEKLAKAKKSAPASTAQKATKRKRGGDSLKDDAPRAFKRLMAFAGGKRTRSGLDDGNSQPASKKKNNNNNAKDGDAPTTEPEQKKTEDAAVEKLTIKPGEKLADFNRRVDAALPISGLASKPVKNGQDPLGLKVWRTNKERKMHKLYDEWKEEERKIQDQRAEETELAEEKAAEEGELGIDWKGTGEPSGGNKKKKKGQKRARLLDESTSKERDPWDELKKKRGEARIGLHDVAQAPPELPKNITKKLTVHGAAVDVDGIPKAAGSLRRREELQGVRNEIVASYRKMMEEKNKQNAK